MPHSMTEPSQQSTQSKKLVPSRLDLSFTAVPYSQTYESKPPILMVPPRNPLRNAKPSSDAAAAAAAAPAGAAASSSPSPSPSPASGNAGDAPYSMAAGLHSVFSPLGIRQPSTVSSSISPRLPEVAERWDDVLGFSGYWDELDEFTETPSHKGGNLQLTGHVPGASSSPSSSSAGAGAGAEPDNKAAVPPPPEESPEPEPPKATTVQTPPKSQAKSNANANASASAAESAAGEQHPRRRRTFWSQIRRGRKSVSTIGSEPESVPPLSPAQQHHPDKDKNARQRSIAESESSGSCSMHTPTSAECPNDMGDGLLSFHQVLATAAVPDPEPSDERERKPARERRQAAKAEKEIDFVAKGHHPVALPGLVNSQQKPLPTGELPHTLTVVIPEGRLFEDDFLDSLSF